MSTGTMAREATPASLPDTSEPAPILVADGLRGWYIPEFFCENWRAELAACGLAEEGYYVEEASYEMARAAEPVDPDDMWEVWERIVRDFHTTIDGVEYTLYEADGGDLFLIPDGFDTEEDWW